MKTPQILAPAGDTQSFLAAVAAGADAIYCGLKIFSARMEADNFSIEELSRLTRLAHQNDIKVYVALNSLIKDHELDRIFSILCKLSTFTQVDALILQDPGVVLLAKQAGFKGEFHLSTLGNLSFSRGFNTAITTGFSRVVLPREFTIDDIKAVAETVKQDQSLEVFIHGALCYSVSGRCYWSSWFGGKSALRGRCVQPCRRVYTQKGAKKRHFSCVDFSADVLVKVLSKIPQIAAWKIEGRKKSAHYVYYTVKAYKLLRDEPSQKKQALAFLDYALGRQFSHYNLLTHRMMNPLDHQSETGSGLFMGRVKNPNTPFFIPREALFASDLLRIGHEDDPFHAIQRVTRPVPKKGKLVLKKNKGHQIKKGTPVYLIDRQGDELTAQIKTVQTALEQIDKTKVTAKDHKFSRPKIFKTRAKPVQIMAVARSLSLKGAPRKKETQDGYWISSKNYSLPIRREAWLWTDPLLFPAEEKPCADYIRTALKKGAKKFVLNAPWQVDLFPDPAKVELWAGPFCNIANRMTLESLRLAGFSGAIVSPELDRQTFLALPGKTTLPLGVMLYANWPVAISRIISPDLKPGQPFISPKGEISWTKKLGSNYMTYPNWPLDLTEKQTELEKAGYRMFVSLYETIPKQVKMKNRPGLWNWHLKLL